MSPAERQRLRDQGARLVADWPLLAQDEVDRLVGLLRPGLAGGPPRGHQLGAADVHQAAGKPAA